MGNTGQKDWISKLQEALAASPIATNVGFFFLFMALEKVVEAEFECPCEPVWNILFAVGLFTLPAIISFSLMMLTLDCNCQCRCNCNCSGACKMVSKIFFSLASAFVWLELLFFNGDYYACARTSWTGTYTKSTDGDRRRWCATAHQNETNKKDTFKFYGESQVFGMIPLLLICVELVVFVIMKYCCAKGKKGSACCKMCCKPGTEICNGACCNEGASGGKDKQA